MEHGMRTTSALQPASVTTARRSVVEQVTRKVGGWVAYLFSWYRY